MKSVLLSYYYNLHKLSISEEFYIQTDGCCVFMAIAQMSSKKEVD